MDIAPPHFIPSYRLFPSRATLTCLFICPSKNCSTTASDLLKPLLVQTVGKLPTSISPLRQLRLSSYFPYVAVITHLECTKMATKGKAAPASTDEQFKFLISCIRYSNNGKVSL